MYGIYFGPKAVTSTILGPTSTATLMLLSFTSRYQVPGGIAEDSPRIFSCARILALHPKPRGLNGNVQC